MFHATPQLFDIKHAASTPTHWGAAKPERCGAGGGGGGGEAGGGGGYTRAKTGEGGGST